MREEVFDGRKEQEQIYTAVKQNVKQSQEKKSEKGSRKRDGRTISKSVMLS